MKASTQLALLIVVVGIVLRVAATLILFGSDATHHLSSHIQPDALGYYEAATTAATGGFQTITASTPSPGYVRVLAAWFVLFGSSVISILFFNLLCFVLTCVLVALPLRRLPRSLAMPAEAVVLGAFALSPMLIFSASQPLKESAFTLMATAAIVSVWRLGTLVATRETLTVRHSWLPLVALIPAVYALSSVRAYYAFLVGVSLILLFGAAAIIDRRKLAAVASLAGATFIPFGTAFVAGSGAPIAPYIELATNPTQAQELVRRARRGFAASGGNTNLAAEEGERIQQAVRDAHAKGMLYAPTPSDLLNEPAWSGGMAVGVAVLFIPITLLRAFSIVDLPSSSQLLLADVDTLFLDATLLAVGVLLWRQSRRQNIVWPYVIFSLSSAILLAGLMGYVVTNFGTLVRLRLMLATALWTLPFALQRLDTIEAEPVSGDAAA